MVFIPLTQQASKPASDKDASKLPGITTAIHPGTMHSATSGQNLVFTYFPNGMGNDLPTCQLFTGIEISIAAINSADEFELLFKTTVDSFPEISEDATVLQLGMTIEHVFNDLHGSASVKIESIRVVQHDPASDELRYRVIEFDCPTCHKKTKVVLSWEAVQARSKNPNPIVNMFFKKDKTECGHSFIAFIDRTLKVRGCDAIDM